MDKTTMDKTSATIASITKASTPSNSNTSRRPNVTDMIISVRTHLSRAVMKDVIHPLWGSVAEPHPVALVQKNPATKELYFTMVHRLRKYTEKSGSVWVGELKEGKDAGIAGIEVEVQNLRFLMVE